MCTVISIDNGGFCYGRNMDIEFPLAADVVTTPRYYPLKFRRTGELNEHYAFIGAAAMRAGSALYCDGMNEKGLCAAALSFPDCAYLRGSYDGLAEIAPFEVIPWVLSQCADIPQVMALLNESVLHDIPFSDDLPNTPLHWHFSDGHSSLVLECTVDGMQLYQDDIGVLTNAPRYPFHRENLRQYTHLTPGYPDVSERLLPPFGRGFGAIGLPGDASPTSRYVRAAFLKLNSPEMTDEYERIAHMFHLLGCVSMTRGSVYTEDGREEHTAYSSCMSGGRYLFRTYNGCSVTEITMGDVTRDNLSVVQMKESRPLHGRSY